MFPHNFIQQSHPKEADAMAELEVQLRSTLIKHEKSWRMSFLATAFRNLAEWVRICDRRVGIYQEGPRPKGYEGVFHKYLEKCYKRLCRNNIDDEISMKGDLNAGRSTTRGLGKNIGQQPSHHLKNGTTVQHEMLDTLGDDWIKKIVPKFSCPPWCGHQLVTTQRDPGEVASETKDKVYKYKIELAKWNSQYGTKKSDLTVPNKRPVKHVIPELIYVCMCTVNCCTHIVTGDGCVNCRATHNAGDWIFHTIMRQGRESLCA